eukprot:TRINITY_DN7398_c0_g1_i3.p1 TRINITY_DN7398_c0_g1~~TRINITY_DN7398_c0_g1_i3.p1  ORF type:complete len:185 (+),score=19.49 TRINITY_DN7398_c0_g1_i3:276-830(+)
MAQCKCGLISGEFFSACIADDVKVVDELLSTQKEPIDCDCRIKGSSVAIENGCLEVVKLFRGKYKQVLSKDSVIKAASMGHESILKYLYLESSVHYIDIPQCYLAAAEHGREDVIHFLFATSAIVPINEMFVRAAIAGQFHMIKFLYENFRWRPSDDQALKAAVSKGESHKHIAHYLESMGKGM